MTLNDRLLALELLALGVILTIFAIVRIRRAHPRWVGGWFPLSWETQAGVFMLSLATTFYAGAWRLSGTSTDGSGDTVIGRVLAAICIIVGLQTLAQWVRGRRQ